MAYIGSTPTSQNFISGTDYFNGTGSQTAFTLTRSVNSVNDVEVVVNNVIQQPNSYTVSGTTLTLSAAPSSGTNNVYVRYLATNQQSFTVGNNTVGYNQLTTDIQSKFAMKNRIINGAMVIDQRNAGASVTPTASGYTLDRWNALITQSSKLAVQQVSTAGSPAGFKKALVVTSLSAYSSVASDIFCIEQPIEGFNIADLEWGNSNAKTVTLSFWVYSSQGGTLGGALTNNNSGGYRSYPFTYTATANTWTQVSVTIPGDTTGTWNTTNGVGILVSFNLGCGSTYSGTAGSWSGGYYFSATGATSVVGTNGATFYITGVQLEVGSSATGYEYRQYQQELALCQRYYEHSFGLQTPSNGASTTTLGSGAKQIATQATWSGYQGGYTSIPLLVQKRTTPTVVNYGNSQGYLGYISNGSLPTTQSTVNFNSGLAINGQDATSLSVSNQVAQGMLFNIIGGWAASAEL